MSQPYRLPARGAAGAPHFDPTHPHSLLDFFEDLEYMLEEAAVVDEQKRKEHAIRYAPGEHKLLWRSFPSHDEDRSYEDFKKEVIREYLGDDGKRLYSLGDLKILVADAARVGFRSSSEFKAYSRNFRIVADYLVKHNVLRDDERDRLFLKGIPSSLAERILGRLRIKCPDVLAPRQPYSQRSATTATPTHSTSRQTPPHLDLSAPKTGSCHYCGEETHIIRRCPQVEADINAGLIKRNESGQVVLKAGSYVPNAIAGPTLRSRVQEYYRQHPDARPSSPAVPQLLFEPVLRASSTPPTQATIHSRGLVHGLEHDAGLFQQLEHEMFVAERGKTSTRSGGGTQSTREERAKRRAVRFEDPPEEAVTMGARKTTVEDATDGSEQTRKPASENRSHAPVTASAPSSPPPAIVEHPFRNVRDATYAPPTQRNYGLPSNPARSVVPPRKNEAAYKTLVPVYDPKHAKNVFKRCLDAPISLTHKELLALAPEIRSATREACSPKRVPVEAGSEREGDQASAIGTKHAAFLADMPAASQNAVEDADLQQTTTPPPGAIVIQDPVEQYLRAHPDERPKPLLRTSADSLAIRAIEGTFQGGLKSSCILDSGSAIVSMSEGLCHALGLAYDPSIVLEMQSANGELNPSLGLARNVLGTIVVYLQFHVIRSPAYDAILGRPFDVLTESVVQTFGDGSQTITLHDPNSELAATVPTLPRKPPQYARTLPPPGTSFRDSRI
ncbi:hypothetical protein PYCCODRAFT_1368306 [Trametes coccinea BRFM310]|uniref:CCHC-type domain-containing protein n=1 Tax=Trametes coccinea (strain BRFM310) TaxID=1353009 RepID=A0A1Y2IL42_TRAC3|nr:hypothetical protein PYCCODRAFT_1368306 [Trametes coccinea BRFM310]